jgi:LuxR family transcriptional regulator of csgAB operon
MSEALNSIAEKQIALCSTNSSLQTGLLAKLIGEELDLTCKVYKNFADIPGKKDIALLLIDCHGEEPEALVKIAKEVHNHDSGANAALLNAHYESEHENLLDWPCISGLFYVDTEHDQLIRGLGCLLEGDYWVPRRLLHHFLDKNRKTPANMGSNDISLTRRERQILSLINDGATNADIASELEVSEHTIKSHLYNVYKKINVRNRLEAANWVRNQPNLDLS